MGNGAGCDMGLKLRPPVKACRQKLAASNIFTKARTLTGWDQSELSAYVADRCPGYAGSTRSWRYWEAGGEPSIDVYLAVRGLVEEHEGKRRVG